MAIFTWLFHSESSTNKEWNLIFHPKMSWKFLRILLLKGNKSDLMQSNLPMAAICRFLDTGMTYSKRIFYQSQVATFPWPWKNVVTLLDPTISYVSHMNRYNALFTSSVLLIVTIWFVVGFCSTWKEYIILPSIWFFQQNLFPKLITVFKYFNLHYFF